ncbi:MAG: hypothetical protein JO023_15615 [Chloroflexi bacterium]|nr:hypothetical protein [Chloroflexota bacterium]
MTAVGVSAAMIDDRFDDRRLVMSSPKVTEKRLELLVARHNGWPVEEEPSQLSAAMGS